MFVVFFVCFCCCCYCVFVCFLKFLLLFVLGDSVVLFLFITFCSFVVGFLMLYVYLKSEKM